MALYKVEPIKKKKRIKKVYKKCFLITIFSLVALIGGMLFVKPLVDNYMIQNTSKEIQSNKIHGSIQKPKIKNEGYALGSGIPSNSQLKKYRNYSGQLAGRGYLAIPKQNGVSIPVTSIQINEGSTNNQLENKAMASGAVTAKPGQSMGEPGNFAVAAHNFGNNVTFFSPLQRSVNVDKQPKAYLTDGKKIYIYQFNKGYENDGVDQPTVYKPQNIPGKRIINEVYGGVLCDSVADNLSMLSLQTCDEPGRVVNLHPENRIIMTGLLVETKSWNDATNYERGLFRQLN